MDIINYNGLRQGLLAFGAKHAYRDLERSAGITSSSIGRIANGIIKRPTMETWLKLHQAAPEFIPPPPLLNPHQRHLPIEPNSSEMFAISELGEERRIPVFDAGAGSNCFWSDGGYPVGESDEFLYAPMRTTDENTFAVRVHGESMLPEIKDGDLAIVVPTRQLEHGKLCFVTNTEDPEGERLIRRYFKYGDTVVLRPDNPAKGYELEINVQENSCYRVFKVTELRKRGV